MEQSLLEKLIVAQLVKKFPAFCALSQMTPFYTHPISL
jgi:hypothetical protein